MFSQYENNLVNKPEVKKEPKKPFDSAKFLLFLSSALVVMNSFPNISNANSYTEEKRLSTEQIKLANSESITQIPKNINELLKRSKENPEMLNNVSINLKLSEFRLYILYNEKVLKSYPVSIGKSTSPTPIGEFNVLNKGKCLDPQNLDRNIVCSSKALKNFIAFKVYEKRTKQGELVDATAGIHESWNGKPINKANTNGCIGTSAETSNILFQIIKVGTKVNVAQ
jgi:lipoprotein-anchoring transpeptidase ErfK/SrfK